MAGTATIQLWRYNQKIELGDPDNTITLPNGVEVNGQFKPILTLHCAPYRISDRNIFSTNGTDLQNTKVVAVRHNPAIDYDSYVARYRNRLYNVTYIVPDFSRIVSYDLLSLKQVIKNGSSQAGQEGFFTNGNGDD